MKTMTERDLMKWVDSNLDLSDGPRGATNVEARDLRDLFKGVMLVQYRIMALQHYSVAQLVGNTCRDAAIRAIHEGIKCFPTISDAVKDADENIARTTKRDFMAAHFYELVKSEAIKMRGGSESSNLDTIIGESGLDPVAAKALAQSILDKVDDIIIESDPSPKMVLHEPYRTIRNSVSEWFVAKASQTSIGATNE